MKAASAANPKPGAQEVLVATDEDGVLLLCLAL